MIIADVDLELLRGKEFEFHEWLDRKLDQVRLEEREACAKVVNDDRGLSDDDAIRLMRAIRARGEK